VSTGTIQLLDPWFSRQMWRILAALLRTRYAGLVVERDDVLGRPCQVGDDQADARIKLAGVLISRFA
jgi:hypothetical protein